MSNIQRQSPEAFIVRSQDTIKQALVVITNNKHGTAVVVDDHDVFRGIVSDGDIRRAMVQGGTEFTPLEKLVNTNCFYVADDAADEEIQKIFDENSGVNIVPVLNTENKVTGVAV